MLTPLVGLRPRGGPVQAKNPEPLQPAPAPQPPPPVEFQGVDPLMVSSLPPMASGFDAYARQFYRSPRLPYRRYLPIRSQ